MKRYLKFLLIAVIFIGCGKENSSNSYQEKDYKPQISEVKETYPMVISPSWGCPAVSEDAFEHIHQMIQSTDKRVLLWIL